MAAWHLPFDTDTGVLIAVATLRAGDVSALATQGIPGGPGCQPREQKGPLCVECWSPPPQLGLQSAPPASSLSLESLTRASNSDTKRPELGS